MTRREGSTQARTLEAIKAGGQITIKGLQAILDLPGAGGWARISHAIRDLSRTGYVERCGRATYRYLGEPEGLDYAAGQKRMVRVIRIRTRRREPFTARQLAELAEVGLDWAKRYLSFARKQGLIGQRGMTNTAANVRAKLYLGVEESLNEEWPALRRQAKTEQLDNAVSEIRKETIRMAGDCRACRETLTGMRDGMVRLIASIDAALALIKEKTSTGEEDEAKS
jgi:soluble cytochrome b562